MIQLILIKSYNARLNLHKISVVLFYNMWKIALDLLET